MKFQRLAALSLISCAGFLYSRASGQTNLALVPAALQETFAKAQAGDAEAELNLGTAYEDGRGIGKDLNQAAQWLRKAADQGNAQAQNRLGVMYVHGWGVETNYSEAIRLYHKAADQGFASAQANLGRVYELGNGVTKDYAEAVNWYRKAADQGYAGAEYNLGLMFQNGTGVEKDIAEARRWFQKAADQGNELAKRALSPSEFNSLNAWQIGISKSLTVATDAAFPAFPVSSTNSDKLAYVNKRGAVNDQVVVVSLPELKVEKTFDLPGKIVGLAWSPNSERIAAVDQSGTITVIEIGSGRKVPLPVILSGDKEIFWLKETEISSFWAPQETLNLDSLQIYGDDSAHDKIYAAMLRSTHPLVNLAFDLDNRIVNTVYIQSKGYAYRKQLLSKDSEQHGEYRWSPSAQYIAEATSRDGNMKIILYVLGKADSSRFRWPLIDVTGTGDLATAVNRVRGNKGVVTATVYSPMKNPLNGKVVGPTGQKKALGSLIVQDGKVFFETTDEWTKPNVGDFVTEIMWWTALHSGTGGDITEAHSAILGDTN